MSNFGQHFSAIFIFLSHLTETKVMSVVFLLLPVSGTDIFSSAVPVLSLRDSGGSRSEKNWLYYMPNHWNCL